MEEQLTVWRINWDPRTRLFDDSGLPDSRVFQRNSFDIADRSYFPVLGANWLTQKEEKTNLNGIVYESCVFSKENNFELFESQPPETTINTTDTTVAVIRPRHLGQKQGKYKRRPNRRLPRWVRRPWIHHPPGNQRRRKLSKNTHSIRTSVRHAALKRNEKIAVKRLLTEFLFDSSDAQSNQRQSNNDSRVITHGPRVKIIRQQPPRHQWVPQSLSPFRCRLARVTELPRLWNKSGLGAIRGLSWTWRDWRGEIDHIP